MSDGRVRRKRAPGWYRDPDDPTQLRHWSGRGWSARRRSWPAWDISVTDLHADLRLPGGPEAGGDGAPLTDGPVRPARLPAGAARHAAASGGTVAWLAPASASTSARGLGTARAGRTAAAGSWGGSRRPLAVFAVLVAVALLLMAVSVGVSRPRAATGSVAADTAFVERAATLCATGLASLRTPAMGAAAPDAVAEAASARRSAATVDALVGQLAGVGTNPGTAGAVGAWLATWRAYVADQRHLADVLDPAGAADAAAAPGAQGGPGVAALAAAVRADVTQADDFATTNGLDACQLGAAGALAGTTPVP